MAEEPVPKECKTIPKTWTDPQGKILQLLSNSTVDLKLRGMLLIAKYGDPDTGFITCLDFYRVKQESNADGQGEFVLLKHDYKPGMMVTSVEPVESKDRAAIFVTRETVPRAGKQREGLRYTWRYDKDYTLSMDLEIGTWAIPK